MPLRSGGRRFAWLGGTILVGVLGLGACQGHDLGQPCGTSTDALPEELVDGETPVVEVVRIERDSVCESFKCLTHRGLDPYCTKECARQTDCPKGFACEQVQETGPLAEQKFCVYEEGCTRNSDCGALGEINCVKYGCVDACALDPLGTCTFHRLTCVERDALGCECAPDDAGNPRSTCPDDELLCTPPDLGTSLDEGSVQQLNVCVPKR